MSFGQIFYYFALALFAFMTFVIIRNYYRNKFNDKGQRMDMLDQYEENKK